MKNWIFIFMISMITLPGYGKVKVQKPKMKHPTAFAILVDEVTYEKIPGAIEAYRDAIEKDGLSAYIVSGNWESPDQVRKEIVALSRRKPVLEGIVLVGDIPVAMIRNAQHLTTAFKMDEEAFPFIESSVPSDRFYDDLHLTFDFIRRDSVHPDYFYYKLREDSPQQLQPALYSGRIKYPEAKGEDKYKAIAEYLYKVVREKQETNELDCFTSFTGNAYNSECLLAWMDERLALEENFPLAWKNSRTAKFLNFRMADYMKFHLFDELQRDELDVMLFHEHGAPDQQYICEGPAPVGMNGYVKGIKAAIYNEVRKEVRKGKGTPEEIQDYFIQEYDLEKHFFDDLYHPELLKADSIANANTGIVLEDLKQMNTYPRFVMFDACYNGSFHLPGYVAGYYIFNDGKTIVAQGNSRNVLQDRWTIEMIGLLSQGIRVGQWNRLIATLEGHIIGDPTFRFSVAVPHTLALDIVKNPADRQLREKYSRSAIPDVQSLAWRMLADQDERHELSPRLLKLFRESPCNSVRMEALKLLSRYANDDFVEAIRLGLYDAYELIRRNAAAYAGKCGDPRLIGDVVRVWLNTPESERVNDVLQSALYLFPVEKVTEELKTLQKSATTVTPFALRQRQIGEMIGKLTDKKQNRWLDYAEIPKATLSLKKQISMIRYIRNNPFHFNVEAYLKLLGNEAYDKEVRIHMAEALGWFNYSYRRDEIRTAMEKMLEKGGLPETVQREVCQTINRLK